MKLMAVADIYRLKKIDEIQEILTAERDKRNELSTKCNRGVNIIGVIYRSSIDCYGFTSICRKSRN